MRCLDPRRSVGNLTLIGTIASVRRFKSWWPLGRPWIGTAMPDVRTSWPFHVLWRRRSRLMFRRAAIPHQQRDREIDLHSYEHEERIDLQVPAPPVTLTVSILALTYYVNWP